MKSQIPLPPRIADIAASELEKRILEGSLRPGDRLPSERDLSVEMAVSRPSLREAIHRLVSKGLLKTRHGGGTYVTDRLDAQFSDPWVEMIKNHPFIHRDLVEFRSTLETQAARFAAERATEADIDRLDRAHNAMQNAFFSADTTAYISTDVTFHMVISEASHNVLISHLTSSLLKLIHGHITVNIDNLYAHPKRWETLHSQHNAIWKSIREHNPDEAAACALAHIAYVQQSLEDAAEQGEREKTALRRLGSH